MNIKIKIVAAFLLILLCLSFQRQSMSRVPETREDVANTDWNEEDDPVLALNGKGVHQLLFFKIYEISFYLEKKSMDPAEILTSNERKVIVLKLLRNLSSGQLREALYNGFNDNCVLDCDRFNSLLDSIASKIPDLNEGESLQFSFFPSKLRLKSSRGEVQEIKDPDFSSKFLAIWLGNNPPSQSLKNKILGLE